MVIVVYDRLNELVFYFTRIEIVKRQLTSRYKKHSNNWSDNPQKGYQYNPHIQRVGQRKLREDTNEKKTGPGDNHNKRDN